jgi:transposase InsO family protein
LSSETSRLCAAMFHWGTLARDAESFQRSCLTCQERKSPRGPRPVPTGTVSVSRRGELVAMDLLGGLPPSANGWNYVLVMMDYFTRYAVAVPLRSKECQEVAAAFESSWIAPLGPPASILTDQGGEFSGAPMSALLRRYRMKHRWTTAYHPQCDGMVERFNQTLAQMMSTRLASASPSSWPDVLQSCVHAYNAATSSSTKYSPHYLLFADPSPYNTSAAQPTPTPAQAADIQRQASSARQEVRDLNATRQARVDNINARISRFRAGDLVMVRNPAIRQRPFSKLDRPWIGPCHVLQVKSDTNLLIKRIPTGYTATVNRTNVKPFRGPLPPHLKRLVTTSSNGPIQPQPPADTTSTRALPLLSQPTIQPTPIPQPAPPVFSHPQPVQGPAPAPIPPLTQPTADPAPPPVQHIAPTALPSTQPSTLPTPPHAPRVNRYPRAPNRASEAVPMVLPNSPTVEPRTQVLRSGRLSKPPPQFPDPRNG